MERACRLDLCLHVAERVRAGEREVLQPGREPRVTSLERGLEVQQRMRHRRAGGGFRVGKVVEQDER